MSKRAASAVIGVVGLILAAPPAQAGVTFCNQFPHVVYVAVAYPQDNSNAWISRGWLNIDPGGCSEFDTALKVKVMYYRAESEKYRDHGRTAGESHLKNLLQGWG